MPTRLLREGINTSEKINTLSDSAELLYRRLFSVADDYGRFWADAEVIRGHIFQLKLGTWSKKRVSRALTECFDKRVLFKYGNGTYLVFPKYGQRIRSKSKFPAPPRDLLSAECQADLPTNGGQPADNPPPQAETYAKAKPDAITKTEAPAVPTAPPVRVPVAALVQGIVGSVKPDYRPDTMQELKGALSSLYRRGPEDRWTYLEESILAEISRRPAVLQEFQSIVNFRRAMPMEERKKFFPQTLQSLLEKWTGTLDRARMTAPPKPKPAAPPGLPAPERKELSDEQRRTFADELRKLRGGDPAGDPS